MRAGSLKDLRYSRPLVCPLSCSERVLVPVGHDDLRLPSFELRDNLSHWPVEIRGAPRRTLWPINLTEDCVVRHDRLNLGPAKGGRLVAGLHFIPLLVFTGRTWHSGWQRRQGYDGRSETRQCQRFPG